MALGGWGAGVDMIASHRKQLTRRQQQVMMFIIDHWARFGVPPTYREIAAKFGIRSPNGVTCHLKALEAKGWIKRRRRESRGIALGPSAPFCPMCGGRREATEATDESSG